MSKNTKCVTQTHKKHYSSVTSLPHCNCSSDLKVLVLKSFGNLFFVKLTGVVTSNQYHPNNDDFVIYYSKQLEKKICYLLFCKMW